MLRKFTLIAWATVATILPGIPLFIRDATIRVVRGPAAFRYTETRREVRGNAVWDAIKFAAACLSALAVAAVPVLNRFASLPWWQALELVCVAIGSLSLLAIFLLILWLSRERPLHSQPRDPSAFVPIHIINFEHLPANLLESGWVKAYPDEAVTPMATAIPSAPVTGSVAINAPPGHAYDYNLPKNARPASKVEFTARYRDETMIFTKLRLTSRNGARTEEKQIKYEVGTRPPYPTDKYEQQEYTYPLRGEPLKDGWRRFEIYLPEVVSKTWARNGLDFGSVLLFRIRGALEISPITFYEERPGKLKTNGGQ